MKTFLRLFIVTLISINLFGCGDKPLNDDPQATLDKAWEKLAEKNAEYDSGSIEFDGKASLAFNGSEGDITGNGEIQFDNSDAENPKTAVSADLSAKGNLEGEAGSIDLSGDLKSLDNSTYIFLKDLKLDINDPQRAMMANLLSNTIKNQWILMPGNPLGEDLISETKAFRNKAVAEVAKENNFFEVQEDLGSNTFEVVINPEKFQTYLNKLSELDGSELTEEELAEIEQTINSLDYTLQVKIGSEYDIEWIKGSMTAENPDEDETMTFGFEGTLNKETTKGSFELSIDGLTPGTLSASFTAHHKDDTVTIEGPDPSEILDLGALLEGGLGGGLGAGFGAGLEGELPSDELALPEEVPQG